MSRWIAELEQLWPDVDGIGVAVVNADGKLPISKFPKRILAQMSEEETRLYTRTNARRLNQSNLLRQRQDATRHKLAHLGFRLQRRRSTCHWTLLQHVTRCR